MYACLRQDMQLRRDLREDLSRQLILEAELDYLEGANAIVKAALEAGAQLRWRACYVVHGMSLYVCVWRQPLPE